MSAGHAVGTLAVTLLFCLVFLRASDLKILGRMGHRMAVSLAGGAAVAYVFMDLSPELQEAASRFREATSFFSIKILDYGIHAATMLGFVVFYGLEVLVIRSHDEADRQRRREADHAHSLFRIHMVAFAAYAWIVSYLLVRSLEETALSLSFYAAAMIMHFLCLAHSLREEHGALYDRIGAWLLAASCVAGWGCGMAFVLPEPAIGVLLGVVAGGIMVNTMILEIPREKEGRFVPFLLGAAGYSGLLLLAR